MTEGENPIIGPDGTQLGSWTPLNAEDQQSGGVDGAINDIVTGWEPLDHEGQHGEPTLGQIIEKTLERNPNVRGINAVRERVAEGLIRAAKAENPQAEIVDVLTQALRGLVATGPSLRRGVSLEPFMVYHDHLTGMLVNAATASKR